MNPKTTADLAFEEYLNAHGVEGYEYEQPIEGSDATPDYRLPWKPEDLIFEVKGFDGDAPDPGFRYFDPHQPIKEKINAAAKQFSKLKQFPCSLVLHHSGPALVDLGTEIVYGAMLGKIGFEIPFDAAGGGLHGDKSRAVFTWGGKMLWYGPDGRPTAAINTTIDAIVVVEHYPIGEKRFNAYIDDKIRERGRKMDIEEYWAEIVATRGIERDVSLRTVRVVTHENPYARVPLPRDLFRGPYDERYGAEADGRMVRLFAGPLITAFEHPAI